MGLYEKISPTLSELVDEHRRKIILYDPSEIYSRIEFDKHKRHQSFGMKYIFPNEYGICACGCGKKLYGRQTRWYSDDCQIVPVGVLKVLNGDLQYIGGLMRAFLPYRCCECDCEDYLLETYKYSEYLKRDILNWSASGIQVDHIIAVKNGGSAGWLGNYRFICHKCHSIKTKQDNALRKKQLTLL